MKKSLHKCSESLQAPREGARVILREYDLPVGGRIGFLRFERNDDYEIDICGCKCKGSPYPKVVAKILREQVSGYQKTSSR